MSIKQIGIFLDLVKFEHTLFALPFALLATMLAYRAPGPHAPPIAWLWIVVAMVGARTAAMAFNRLADAAIDAKNPRTTDRALPAGTLNRSQVLALVLISATVFFFAAGMLNRLCLMLSPVVLAVLLGYSYSKRFTSLSHLWLGVALGLAPVGAWIAVLGRLDAAPLLLGLAVAFWTAGFDIIYACQDFDFDRSAGLHSLPARAGITGALWISAAVHVLAVALLVLLAHTSMLGWIYIAGVVAAAAVIACEHAIVRPGDISRVNAAFFTANGVVSIVVMAAAMLDMIL